MSPAVTVLVSTWHFVKPGALTSDTWVFTIVIFSHWLDPLPVCRGCPVLFRSVLAWGQLCLRMRLLLLLFGIGLHGVFFHPFTFGLCTSFGWSLSCRQSRVAFSFGPVYQFVFWLGIWDHWQRELWYSAFRNLSWLYFSSAISLLFFPFV